MQEEVIRFYRQTSCFTYLGYYRDFAVNLTDDIQRIVFVAEISNHSSGGNHESERRKGYISRRYDKDSHRPIVV